MNFPTYSEPEQEPRYYSGKREGGPVPEWEWSSVVCRFPIQRFPVEVLATILHEVATNDMYNQRVWKSVMNLCSVCHKWRDVLVRQPRLWTTLVFEREDFGFEYDFDLLVPRLEKWFERAGALPLTLELDFMPNATPLLDDFLVSTSKWEELAFTVWGNSEWLETLFEKAIEASDSKGAPCWKLLNTLSISMPEGAIEPPSLQIYTRLPNLRNLQLSTTMTQYRDLSPTLLSIDLTHISLDFNQQEASVTFFLSVMERCVNLEYFSIFCDDYEDQEQDIAVPITHRNLRHLSVSGIPECILLFLAQLTLPALTALEVHDITDAVEAQAGLNAHQSILELTKRSKCALTLFASRNIPANEDHLLQLLLDMPTLTEVNLSCHAGSWTGAFVKRLISTSPTDEHPPLPKLEAFFLSLAVTAMSDEVVNDFQDFMDDPLRWWLPDHLITRYGLEKEFLFEAQSNPSRRLEMLRKVTLVTVGPSGGMRMICGRVCHDNKSVARKPSGLRFIDNIHLPPGPNNVVVTEEELS